MEDALRASEERFRSLYEAQHTAHLVLAPGSRHRGGITERQEREDFQKLLLHEVSHRVKNSLALVSGLLHVQARTCEAETRRMLEDASARVCAVAKVHDQLWREAGAREMDLAPFLSNLVAAIPAAGRAATQNHRRG